MGDHVPPCGPLEKLEAKVEALNHSVFIGGPGRENASIHLRLVLVEDAIERFGKNSSKLVWIGIGILATLVANLFTGHLMMK